MSERLEFFIHDRPIERAPFHYTQCGLLDVWLLNGFTINEDDGYGPSFDIEDVEDLHDAIAARLVERPAELTAEAFRFLRKRIGLTQAGLAKKLRLTEQTVANYEKGQTRIFGPADSMLRILYLLHVLPPEDGRALVDLLLRDLNDRTAEHRHLIPRDTAEWREHRAAA